MKVGIIREGKNPPDKRVALSPKQCKEVVEKFKNVEIFVQPSPIRCFKDEEYTQLGFAVQEDLSHCDILLGIKEVPLYQLIANKTYLFFSHTIKKQPYNRNLLRTVLEKNIRLIDYETLKDIKDNRLVAFGRYAGLVGAYNGILAYGKRYNLYDLKPANLTFDRQELNEELKKVQLPPIKIAVTGGGRVANGALEILRQLGIREVSLAEYVKNEPLKVPVFVQLHSADYHLPKDETQQFDLQDFYLNPKNYKTNFTPIYQATDLLIAAAFWHPDAPLLFTKSEMRSKDFKIKVIADITCDINGSIPSTMRASTIAEPLYDYNPISETIEAPLSNEQYITVMAIDNLPCEMPRDASVDFGNDLIQRIFPSLFGADTESIIERATIAKDGKLMSRFNYLRDYVAQEV